jgi:transcriptional regulator with XRE-family HTH domain
MATSVMPVRVYLRDERKRQGLSQSELSTMSGVRKATISEIENGHAKSVSFDVLERLARALGVHPATLFIEKATDDD